MTIKRTDEQLNIPQDPEVMRKMLLQLWGELSSPDDRLMLWFWERAANRTEDALNALELETMQRVAYGWDHVVTSGDPLRGSVALHDQYMRELRIFRIISKLTKLAEMERSSVEIVAAVIANSQRKPKPKR